jgi:hypothetical protein
MNVQSVSMAELLTTVASPCDHRKLCEVMDIPRVRMRPRKDAAPLSGYQPRPKSQTRDGCRAIFPIAFGGRGNSIAAGFPKTIPVRRL